MTSSLIYLFVSYYFSQAVFLGQYWSHHLFANIIVPSLIPNAYTSTDGTMSWNPFGKNSSSSTRRSVFTKSLDRDIEREHKKLEYLEETTKKLQKDLKKCNDSTHDFAAANLKIVSNLKTSSLYAKDADFARNVDQCFVAAKEIESAAQSVVAVTTKTAVNRSVGSLRCFTKFLSSLSIVTTYYSRFLVLLCISNLFLTSCHPNILRDPRYH